MSAGPSIPGLGPRGAPPGAAAARAVAGDESGGAGPHGDHLMSALERIQQRDGAAPLAAATGPRDRSRVRLVAAAPAMPRPRRGVAYCSGARAGARGRQPVATRYSAASRAAAVSYVQCHYALSSAVVCRSALAWAEARMMQLAQFSSPSGRHACKLHLLPSSRRVTIGSSRDK